MQNNNYKVNHLINDDITDKSVEMLININSYKIAIHFNIYGASLYLKIPKTNLLILALSPLTKTVYKLHDANITKNVCALQQWLFHYQNLELIKFDENESQKLEQMMENINQLHYIFHPQKPTSYKSQTIFTQNVKSQIISMLNNFRIQFRQHFVAMISLSIDNILNYLYKNTINNHHFMFYRILQYFKNGQDNDLSIDTICKFILSETQYIFYFVQNNNLQSQQLMGL